MPKSSNKGKPTELISIPIGAKFGTLTVVERAPNRINGKSVKAMWRCKCTCGTISVVASYSLRHGNIVSCSSRINHSVRYAARTCSTTYPKALPEYAAWHTAKSRCFNPKDDRYSDYGGRGITMAKEWVDDFDAFVKHIGPRPERNKSLDRIDNDGNYEPGNVWWATKEQQRRNQRRNFKGKMPRKYPHETGLDYAERLARVGIRYKIVGQRRTA